MFVLKNRHPDYRERLEHSGRVSGTVKIEASPKAVLLTRLCSPEQLQDMRAKLVAMLNLRRHDHATHHRDRFCGVEVDLAVVEEATFLQEKCAAEEKFRVFVEQAWPL